MRKACPEGNNKQSWNCFPSLKILFVFLLLGDNQPAGLLSTKTRSAVTHTQTNTTVNVAWPTGVQGHVLGVMKIFFFHCEPGEALQGLCIYTPNKHQVRHTLLPIRKCLILQNLLLYHMFRKPSLYLSSSDDKPHTQKPTMSY